nr:TlpA family protein disulfide reductase [Bacteroidales bacterium]
LQNELYKYPLGWSKLHFDRGDDPDRYIASVDSILNAHNASIDQLCKEHPTLSARFAKYKKDNMLWQYAYYVSIMQFYCPNFEMPENALRYAHDRFWTQLESPYTLHRELNGFVRNYIDIIVEENEGQPLLFDIRDHLDEIEWDDNEKATLDKYFKWMDDNQPRLQAASTPEEKRRLWQADSTKNADLQKQYVKIIQSPKVNKMANEYFLLSGMQDTKHLLDSLNVDQIICDKTYSRYVYDLIDHERASINPRFLDTLRAWVITPSCIERVEKLNERYIAIENRDFDKLVIKSSDNLEGMSDGEALLRKLVEPYKGKFVLLDIWGTWCGPCKEALSHSTEEYARLSDFDIEYLYLANHSPQDSWENVIKEYNVSGDNVAHYNLPDDQQAAIERYLDIHSWPTYKLFDRNGNLLDLDVDSRDLEGTARLLEQLNR